MADTRRVMLVVASRARNADDCRLLLDKLDIKPTPKRGRGRPRGEYRHGDARKYAQGCHCTECRAAHAERHQEQQRRRMSDPAAADRAGHGKASTYQNYACRCVPCTEANSAKSAAYKAQRREHAVLAKSGGGS